jgi:hypothetical protein
MFTTILDLRWPTLGGKRKERTAGDIRRMATVRTRAVSD